MNHVQHHVALIHRDDLLREAADWRLAKQPQASPSIAARRPPAKWRLARLRRLITRGPANPLARGS